MNKIVARLMNKGCIDREVQTEAKYDFDKLDALNEEVESVTIVEEVEPN